jgi:hypothetical protein
MKAQIRAKTRNRGRGWAEYRRPDVKNGVRGPRRGDGWRCSNLPQSVHAKSEVCDLLSRSSVASGDMMHAHAEREFIAQVLR